MKDEGTTKNEKRKTKNEERRKKKEERPKKKQRTKVKEQRSQIEIQAECPGWRKCTECWESPDLIILVMKGKNKEKSEK
jgi:hypothetical protein